MAIIGHIGYKGSESEWNSWKKQYGNLYSLVTTQSWSYLISLHSGFLEEIMFENRFMALVN